MPARTAAAAVAAAFAVLLFAAGGATAGAQTSGQATSANVPDRAEAWYYETPGSPCSSPVGCPPRAGPQPTPFPPGTLHVGVASGQPTAVAFVKPDLSTVTAGAAYLGGTLSLPVSSDPLAGNVQVAAAKIVACIVTKPFTDGVAGSTDTPPPFDCATFSAAKPSVTDQALAVDLAPFLSRWGSGLPEYGIALVPAAGIPATDVWHVAFNGRTLTPHPTSTVLYSIAVSGRAPPAQPSPPGGVPPPIVLPPGPTPPTPLPTPGPPPAAAPTVSSPAAPTQGVGAVVPRSVRTFTTVRGFRYSAIMLLPLALLGALSFLAKTLTGDVTPSALRSVSQRRALSKGDHHE